MTKQITLIIICLFFIPFTANTGFDEGFDKVKKTSQKTGQHLDFNTKANTESLYFQITKPLNGVLSINNKTYSLKKSTGVYLPVGKHPSKKDEKFDFCSIKFL